MPEPTLDAWAQIRHDYENTDKPLAHICADNDITIPMLRYRMKRWEWRRRKPLIPREGPPAVPCEEPPMQHEIATPPTPSAAQSHPTPPAFAQASTGDPPPQEPAPGRAQARPGWEGKENIVPRLQSAIARILQAIEATIARLAAGPQHPREMEQAGRALSALTRTLRELNALLGQHRADDDAPDPRDIDEFRQELARRLKGIIAARRQRIEEAKRQET
ncbi:MAG: hypothetical protein PSV22_09050 [Pseudolabrys sp.]|nr:hypothetical protein [Pseudolabrys sp.]